MIKSKLRGLMVALGIAGSICLVTPQSASANVNYDGFDVSYGEDVDTEDVAISDLSKDTVDIDALISAYDLSNEKVHVADHADLLSASDEEFLQSMCEDIEDEKDVNILIVTAKNVTSGGFSQQASRSCNLIFAERKQIASPGVTLFFVDMGLRDFSIESSSGSSDAYYIDDPIISYITDKITQDMTDGKYSDAFVKFLEITEKYVEKQDGFNPDNIFFKWWFDILIAAIISLIIVLPSIINAGGKVTVDESTYIKNGASGLTGRRDDFIRKTVTKTRRDTGGSGGGGGRGGGGGGHSQGGGHF